VLEAESITNYTQKCNISHEGNQLQWYLNALMQAHNIFMSITHDA
jgi:hypothetical protein